MVSLGNEKLLTPERKWKRNVFLGKVGDDSTLENRRAIWEESLLPKGEESRYYSNMTDSRLRW